MKGGEQVIRHTSAADQKGVLLRLLPTGGWRFSAARRIALLCPRRESDRRHRHGSRPPVRHRRRPRTLGRGKAIEAAVGAMGGTSLRYDLPITLALGVLCASSGMGIPTAVMPYLNSAHAAHPTYLQSLERLREMGVLIGSYEPHRPKAGGGADRFRWEEALELLTPRLSAQT